jgi:homospermidine synthase
MNNFNLPKTVFLLGYGAIGKCVTEILLKNFKNINLKVLDLIDSPINEKRFEYIQTKINRDNIALIKQQLAKGDVLIDLSTNIDALEIWSMCRKNEIMYLNTAMEEWEDAGDPTSFPDNHEEMYKTSLGHRHDTVKRNPMWDTEYGVTSVFEHGMNPGMISHFVKKGLLDAAKNFLARKDWTDLDHEMIEKYLNEKNYPKLAQALGLHTIHCSEKDDQVIKDPPKDLTTKFYNTWSCRGFLTEGMVPIQVAQGSHEDEFSKELPRLKNGRVIMSWAPSRHYWGNNIYLCFLIR